MLREFGVAGLHAAKLPKARIRAGFFVGLGGIRTGETDLRVLALQVLMVDVQTASSIYREVIFNCRFCS